LRSIENHPEERAERKVNIWRMGGGGVPGGGEG